MSQSGPVALPSERSFGLLMAGVAGAACLLFVWRAQLWAASLAAILFGGLLAAAWLAPSLLALPNRLWFRFGMLLNRIVSPVVLGAIFFLIITPVGLARRLMKADPLRLAIRRDLPSYWVSRETTAIAPDSLKNQF